MESVLPFKPEVIDQNLMHGTYIWLLTLTDKFANKYQSSLSNWSHFHIHLAASLWCVFSDLFTPNSKRVKIRTFAPGCVPMSFFLYLYIDKKKKEKKKAPSRVLGANIEFAQELNYLRVCFSYKLFFLELFHIIS